LRRDNFADQLFATLDPTLRQVQLAHFGKIILVDTVGFIRELPHDLVAAFRATLEETREADLLLHLVDSHHSDCKDIIYEVDTVLKEIGAGEVPQLQVFNKIDLRENLKPRIDRDESGKPIRVWISALNGAGLDLLEQAIGECLAGEIVATQVTLGPKNSELRAQLHSQKLVTHEELTDEGNWVLDLRLPQRVYKAWQRIFSDINKT